MELLLLLWFPAGLIIAVFIGAFIRFGTKD